MRTIIVNADQWVRSVRTGQIKRAGDLTDIERGSEEWATISRSDRRKLAKKGTNNGQVTSNRNEQRKENSQG